MNKLVLSHECLGGTSAMTHENLYKELTYLFNNIQEILI